jgi:hydroxyacylglutathione hydrolase
LTVQGLEDDKCAACGAELCGSPWALHPDDFGMIERGDMFSSRSHANPIFKAMAPFMFRFGRSERVTPDLKLTEEFDLSAYGFNASVISLPGHSRGSIGILTSEGDLLVGDLLENTKQPALNSIMDDRAAARASVEKLQRLNIKIIYPGHGAPFSMEQLQVNAPTVPSTTA